MDNNLKTISNLFEDKQIRSVWNNEQEDYYFSVVDVSGALTESSRARKYWSDLKRKLKEEGSELSEKVGQLKMQSADGKFYNTDVLNTKGILRLIQSIPSSKAEPFKLWLAQVGNERIDETFDPSKAIDRSIMIYRAQGYSDAWIEKRLKGQLHRFQLTDVWKSGGIDEPIEYGVLTNEIYKAWSGMKASEYKEYKGLRKESLRDNMTDIELVLTTLGEITTRDIAKEEHPQGLKENIKVASRGGSVAKGARDLYEEQTKKTAVTSDNALTYQYIERNDRIE